MSSAAVGRPRDPRVDASLRHHLVQMLAERGPDGFSVEELAVRSQISKAAIYRRYRCRDDLIEAGFAAVNESMPDVTRMSLREALITFLEWVKGAIGSSMTASWMLAIQQMPHLHHTYMRTVVAPRRQVLLDLLRGGQARGLIRQDADLDVLLTCLSAPAVLAGMHPAGAHPAAKIAVSDVVDTVMAAVLTPKAHASGW